MFCNQCEQTAHGIACDIAGVCGKNEDVAALQDALIHALEGLSYWAREAHRLGLRDEQIDILVLKGVFTTLTNVDFDPARLSELIREVVARREALAARVAEHGGCVSINSDCLSFA
ncbi:MAG: hydroxylamine reductase, partial [Puniceicoccales bacterium]